MFTPRLEKLIKRKAPYLRLTNYVILPHGWFWVTKTEPTPDKEVPAIRGEVATIIGVDPTEKYTGKDHDPAVAWDGVVAWEPSVLHGEVVFIPRMNMTGDEGLINQLLKDLSEEEGSNWYTYWGIYARRTKIKVQQLDHRITRLAREMVPAYPIYPIYTDVDDPALAILSSALDLIFPTEKEKKTRSKK